MTHVRSSREFRTSSGRIGVMTNRTAHSFRTANGSDVIERRSSIRGTMHGEPPRTQLTALVIGTYREMPGLALDLRQAARLFGLRDVTCRIILEDLVREGRL